MNDFHVVPAGPEHAGALPALFDRADSPCFCRWWHFTGDKNAWGDRCANAPAESRRELADALARGSDEASGMIAVTRSGEAIGWMKLATAASLPKLYDQRLYRNLPCFAGDRSGVLTIGCFLVDPAWRRRGVARALLDAGIDAARQRGAVAIEAFPRRTDTPAPEELWNGPLALLLECGFEEVHDFRPYPVLRRLLGASAREPGDRAGDRLP